MATAKVISCARAIAEKGLKIAFIESASAGKLTYEFSNTPDSGKILVGGLVCYDACLKEEALEIPHGLLETFTPESAEVTKAMAVSFCRRYEVDICVALTGLTKPGGSETEDKTVGTIFVHAIFPGKEVAVRREFDGSPEQILSEATDAVADLISETIQNLQPPKVFHHE